jgi:hypothetical protein
MRYINFKSQLFVLLFIGIITLGIFTSPISGMANAGNVNELKSSQGASFVVTVYNEIIVMPLQPGWVRFPAFEKNSGNRNHYIVEFLPEGQALDNWEELLTIQGFKGKNVTITQLLGLLKQQIQKTAGEEFVYSPYKQGVISGHNYISALIGCAKLKQNHPSGLRAGEGEFGYYMVIEGKKDLYMVHHSWRGAAYDRTKYPVDERKVTEWVEHMEQITFIEKP